MQTDNVKTLFLAWQAPNRQWFPIGRLTADTANEEYQFDYTKGALRAEREVDFKPLLTFPEFNRHYCASELFPLFRNRILPPSRKDFADYLKTLDIDPSHPDLLDVLAISGGERQTDSFEVFPKINKAEDGSFQCRFFLHGLRHVNRAGLERARELEEGESLQIALELNNPKTGPAILLTSGDYLPLGWTPRYLVLDLLNAMVEAPQMAAKVVKANPPTVPAGRRYLIEMTGRLPEGFDPMSSDDFQPIH